MVYKVLDDTGATIGTGPTCDAAIQNAADNMPESEKAYLQKIGLPPIGVIQNLIDNDEYQLVQA
jgi:hypothetical protein